MLCGFLNALIILINEYWMPKYECLSTLIVPIHEFWFLSMLLNEYLSNLIVPIHELWMPI